MHASPIIDVLWGSTRARRKVALDVPMLSRSMCCVQWIMPAIVPVVGLLLGAAGPPPVDVHGRAGLKTHNLIFAQIPGAGNATHPETTGAVDPRAALPTGSRIVRMDPGGRVDELVLLTADFSAAGRPDLSFDAEHFLFVGKRGDDDRWAVWEMGVDGSGLRRVVDCPGDCGEAIYLSSIYTMDAERTFKQIAFRSLAAGGKNEALYTCRRDGSRVRQITFNPGGASDPVLLSDGRLLFSLHSRAEPTTSPALARDIATLFTVHVDGTDVFPFAGLHEEPAFRGMACETFDGWIVYVESLSDGRIFGGSLVAVARTRSLRTRRVIADNTDGVYCSPSPLGDGTLLASFRPSTGEPEATTFGVYVIDAETGSQIAKVVDSPEWHDVEAVLVRPRPEPAGRSSVVDHSLATGKLYCMNAYLSDREESRRVEEGMIKKVRVVRAWGGSAAGNSVSQRMNRKATGDDPGTSGEVVLGEAIVEPDGSFFLEIPARTPLRLETLDGHGGVLQAMHSWIWVMPQERRGCIGCHADRELTPPNRHVRALRQPPVPVGVRGEAAHSHPHPRPREPKRSGYRRPGDGGSQ